MRKQALRAVTMLVSIIALAFATAVATSAQSGGNTLRADIPFDFVVGSKTLSAGEYSLQQITQDGAGMSVRSSDGDHGVIRLTTSVQSSAPAQKSKLTFRRYGNTYFLAQIWVSGSAQGREMVKSKAERDLAKSEGSLARNAKPEIVTIIADVE